MAQKERKRPFYLVLALLGALAFGTSGALSGWGAFLHYRGADGADPSIAGEGLSNQADRVAVVGRYGDYLHALDAAKKRGWPLGVAELLLGSALFAFALRAFGRSRTARAVLVQLVIVQAGVNAASYFLMRDVAEADLRVGEAEEAAVIRQHMPEWGHPDERAHAAVSLLRKASPWLFAIHTLGSALIVIALTTRRTRELFDSEPEPAPEP
ncbi:MAG: hypothetical protein ACREJ3_11525 [Polyangiaceae bacterium]